MRIWNHSMKFGHIAIHMVHYKWSWFKKLYLNLFSIEKKFYIKLTFYISSKLYAKISWTLEFSYSILLEILLLFNTSFISNSSNYLDTSRDTSHNSKSLQIPNPSCHCCGFEGELRTNELQLEGQIADLEGQNAIQQQTILESISTIALFKCLIVVFSIRFLKLVVREIFQWILSR